MDNLEKELQIEILWKNYEYWKIDQQIGEMMGVFSRTATEIVNDSVLLDRKMEFEAQRFTIEFIQSLQERVRNIF
ncbi:MAG: hypothetical protein WC774_05625 [Candidatus Gracilibacteria bacterium]|jgi:hypothetical protein